VFGEVEPERPLCRSDVFWLRRGYRMHLVE
jgi:hypothetical protein